MNDPAPRSLETALSPAWLSAALSVDVTGVRVVETIKVSATKVRFEADIAGPSGAERRHLCVKGFFDDAPFTATTALNSETEARFYLDFAPHSKVRTPICRYAGVDPRTGHGIILMDDVVVAGGRFLTALEPYSPRQTEASLNQIAALHAEHWTGVDLTRHSWLRNRFADMAHKPLIPAETLQALLNDERSRPLDPAIVSAERLHRGMSALAARDEGQALCLVHGDAHAGNLFEQDGAPALIDWQLAQCSHWALDVAYHIAAVLSVEDRASAEQDLLAHYLDRLRAHGAAPPSWDDAWLAYRTHMIYGYYLWGITRRVEPRIIHEFVKRLGSAVSALESFELLGV